ncbi:UNVERIFIED_CONTAM: hypothetical protein Slati_3056700 [Sesamum latifolium]|uniref:Uncharacterized protein n=1 Tax=Sesamum latifolium TaxID=2727402 RepID=A0AAW2UTM3_9LAMI
MDEGHNFMEGYWASHIEGYKKSGEYQQEVTKIAIPFLEYGFTACKEQFASQGYPPTWEEPSFLHIGVSMVNAPNPFANPQTSVDS